MNAQQFELIFNATTAQLQSQLRQLLIQLQQLAEVRQRDLGKCS